MLNNDVKKSRRKYLFPAAFFVVLCDRIELYTPTTPKTIFGCFQQNM